MVKSRHVIYIPGLGDHTPHGQTKIINTWRLSEVIPHYFRMGWADGEAFVPKLDRLSALVDELYGQGHEVSVVGVSAGAGAAINLYVERPDKIDKLVFICGKILDSEDVNPRYYIRNPAFHESIILTQKNLKKLGPEDKIKMLSLHAVYDNVVYTKYSKIPGVRHRTLPSILHIPTIFLALTIYQLAIINFIKWSNDD